MGAAEPGMAWVPGGEFVMGSADFYAEERPEHRVAVDGFWMDARPVTVAEFRRFYFELAGEGLCVGRDSGAGVTDDYLGQPPYRFSGGTIRRVAVDVSGEPYVDVEREAEAMLSRE